MNKDNKKMARERRAQEREKELRMAKWKKILPILAVAAAVVILIIVMVSGKSGNSANESQSEQAEAVSGQTSSESQTTAAASADSTEASDLNVTATAQSAEIVEFDPTALEGCYDISKDDLTYVQIKVKDYGTITAALDSSIAPISVENFVSLAKEGFYDGLTFHRIIDRFMIQGGDPLGNGTGGSDQTIKGEFSANNVENPITHVRGAVSMARSQDPDSASSQFFIVQTDSTYLDGQYAGFGYVTDGMDIVDQICKDAAPVDQNGTISADEQPVIESVTIIG